MNHGSEEEVQRFHSGVALSEPQATSQRDLEDRLAGRLSSQINTVVFSKLKGYRYLGKYGTHITMYRDY